MAKGNKIKPEDLASEEPLTNAEGKILGPELFDNEPTPESVLESEKKTEPEIDKEEEAIDKLLEGDDSALDDLEY